MGGRCSPLRSPRRGADCRDGALQARAAALHLQPRGIAAQHLAQRPHHRLVALRVAERETQIELTVDRRLSLLLAGDRLVLCTRAPKAWLALSPAVAPRRLTSVLVVLMVLAAPPGVGVQPPVGSP